MKRLWIALSVLVMVWGFSGVSLWHLTRAANQMEATLEQISEAIDKQDAAKLKELTAQFQLEWHHHESFMVHYIHHDALDTLTGAVARLPAYAFYEQYPDLAAETERIQELIYHIWESEIPSLKNIF